MGTLSAHNQQQDANTLEILRFVKSVNNFSWEDISNIPHCKLNNRSTGKADSQTQCLVVTSSCCSLQRAWDPFLTPGEVRACPWCAEGLGLPGSAHYKKQNTRVLMLFIFFNRTFKKANFTRVWFSFTFKNCWHLPDRTSQWSSHPHSAATSPETSGLVIGHLCLAPTSY